MTTGAPKIAVTELMLTSVGGKGGAGNEVAHQAERAAAEKARRNEQQRLCRVKQRLHQVRYGDADKGDGTCKRGHAGGKNARKENQRRAEGF